MITSKDNNLVKLAYQIKDKKFSKKHKLCLIESIKVVSELYLRGLITNILVTEDKYPLMAKYTKVKIDIISDSIANYLSDAVTSDGVFGICSIRSSSNIDYSKCIILDRIQDPSNIGAIIRSASAFGYNTILSIDSVYPYTYKCIRSSMGYIFQVNYIDIDFEDLIKLKNENNLYLISADMNGEIINECKVPSTNYAIVIGNEGQGISDDIMKISDKIIRIPMENSVESLNASVSAGIMMYILK